MEQYNYNCKDKSECWYSSICNDKEKCKESEFCQRHYKMDYLTSASTLEGKQKYSVVLRAPKEDLQAFKRLSEIKSNINNEVLNGKNLLIYSKNTGNGKTEWSKKLLLAWLDSVWASSELECRALFISMPKFISSMKENFTKPNSYYQYINDNIVNADLVVWDEINYKEWTPFEQDYMLNVLSQRLSLGKSNIYTTNYDIPIISEKLGTRLASRIVGCSEAVEFVGNDRRGVNK